MGRSIFLTWALAAACCAIGCDDDSESAADGGADPSDQGAAGAPGDGAPPDDERDATLPPDGGEADGATPPGPLAFAVTAPAPDDIVAGVAEVVARPLEGDTLARIEVTLNGEVIGFDDAPGDGFRVPFRVDRLGDGPIELAVTGFDADGASLGEVRLPLRAVVRPPATAEIGPEGGALATESGVVVIIPPGAVEAARGFRVQDRDPATLPVVGERDVDILAAIDLLPAEGPVDPDLFLLRPAIVHFPLDTPGGAQVGEEPLEVLAIRPDADGDGAEEVVAVDSVVAGAMGATTGNLEGPVLGGLANLTRPGEDPAPGDLVELSAQNLSALPGDATVRFGDRPSERVAYVPGRAALVFLLPPDLAPGPTTVRIHDLQSGRRAEVEIEVASAPAEALDAAEADRRLNALFDALDATLDRFDDPAFEDPDRRLSRVAEALTRLSEDFDDPVGEWRAQLAALRAAVLEGDEADRIEAARGLATLERNLAVSMPGGPDQITKREWCQAAWLGIMFIKYLDFVGNVAAPPRRVADVLTGQLVGLGIKALEEAFRAAGCEDALRRRGVRTYECDLLARARRESRTAALRGDVFQAARRTPADLGLDDSGLEDGQQVDAWALEPVRNVAVDAVLAGTDERATLIDGVSDRRGGYDMPLIAQDVLVDLVITRPDGRQWRVPGVQTPGAEVIDYLPIVIPAPEAAPEGPLEVDDALGPPRGAEAGLDSTDSTAVVTGDFDGDGLTDLLFFALTAEEDPEQESFTIHTLALGQGGASFAPRPLGPFPADDEVVRSIPLFGAQVIDLDGDGDLDLVGPNAPGGDTFTMAALINETEAPGAPVFTPRTLFSGSPDTVCPGATSMAMGDFDGDGRPDILVDHFPGGEDPLMAGQMVEGGRCVFRQTADGRFELQESVAVSLGLQGTTIAATADLNDDGHLDVLDSGRGLALLGDGQGGFEEVRFPEECWLPSGFVVNLPVPPITPADLDNDGDVDVLVERRDALVDFMPVSSGPCLLRNDGTGRFAGEPIPGLPDPNQFPPCVGCASHQLADVDGDGWVDVFVADGDALRLGRNGPAGFVFGALAAQVGDVNHFLAGDVSGDGRPDLVLARDGAADALRVNRVPMDFGHLRVEIEGYSSPVHVRAMAGDFDGDGADDDPPRGTHVVAGPRGSIGVGRARQVTLEARFVEIGVEGGRTLRLEIDDLAEAVQLSDPQRE